MSNHDHDAVRRRRLETIADFLGARSDAFGGPSEYADTSEMLRLWLALPGATERAAALAYLRDLASGIPE